MLKVGDKAPDFTQTTQDGRSFALSAHRGRWVVVYFFPKAFTPGCTSETRQFRDNHEELKSLGAEVVGVSTDDESTQCRFATEHKVGFPILPDASKEISRSFGVLWPLIKVAKRVTFVIDPEGAIAAVFRHEFQVSKHLDDVFLFLRKQR